MWPGLGTVTERGRPEYSPGGTTLLEGLEKREFKRPVKNIKSKAGLKTFPGGTTLLEGLERREF